MSPGEEFACGLRPKSTRNTHAHDGNPIPAGERAYNLEHILWELEEYETADGDPMVAVAVLILDGRLDSLPKLKY